MRAAAPRALRLGTRSYDLTHRPLVMGILNRTVDSFNDRGRYFALEAFLRQAERLAADGADILDVGARPAGLGTRQVPVTEETDLVTESIHELVRRFDVPVSVDTWRGAVVAASFEAGAVVATTSVGSRTRRTSQPPRRPVPV